MAEAVVRVARDRAEQAIDAARPRIERAAQEVTDYVNEHDDQLRAAVARAARIAANMAVPAALRPMADAVNEELHRQPEQKSEPSAAAEARRTKHNRTHRPSSLTSRADACAGAAYDTVVSVEASAGHASTVAMRRPSISMTVRL